MLRTFPPARNARRKSSRRLALALLIGLGFVGTTIAETPAMAQRSNGKSQNSKAFAAAYQPVADVANAEGADYASAKAQLPGVIAAIETPNDRFLAGSLSLLLGNKLNDATLQRQGLELMLASGQADPAQIGQLQFFVGSLAYNAGDYAAARTALQAAVDAGYTQDNPQGLIAESYFKEGQAAQGLDYLKGLIEAQKAAGQAVPDAWYLRGLKVAYDNRLNDQAADWSALLVEHNPTEKSWLQALQVVNALVAGNAQASLDVLRLMALTGSLSQRSEFETYVTTLDPRVLPTEVSKVLASGVQAGAFTSSDPFYTDTKRIVDSRTSEEAKLAADYAAEAASSADGRAAFNAGDVYLSLGEHAKAEEMFKLALEKGSIDRDQVLTRIGIAQVHQSKMAEAKSSFAQISGDRKPVAKMWTAYIESRA